MNEGSDETEVLRVPFAHSEGRSSGVDIVSLAELRGRPLDHRLDEPMRPRFFTFHFVTEGEGRHWLDFQPVELRAGDVLCVRPGAVHAFDGPSTHGALLLLFTPAVLQDMIGPDAGSWRAETVIRPSDADFEVLVAMLRLQATLDTRATEIDPQRVAPHVLASVLEALASVVDRQGLGRTRGTEAQMQLVAGFRAALDHHFAERRTATWFADRLGTSSRTLARACEVVAEVSPKALIDERVALEARRLLAVTGSTIEEIAAELGFSEATNFVKFFRRLAGRTPDGFRRRFGRE